MIKQITATFTILILATSTSHTQTFEDVMQNIVTELVRPAYQTFAKDTKALSDKVAELCAKPNDANLEAAQSIFSQTTTSWGKIEFFRSGPVISDKRLERVLFYPDRKSTGLKQVQRRLAKKDQNLLNAQELANKSVAVQGFGALEFLLFGTGFEILANDNETFRCRYAKAIAQNLNNIATELDTAWGDNSDFVKKWKNPATENSVFLTEQEALADMLGLAVHGLEAVRDIRIGAFVKDEAKKDRPKSALFWRSKNTLQMIEANISMFEILLFKTGFAKLADGDVINMLEFELNQIKRALSAINLPISRALKNEAEREKLVYLKLTLGFLIKRLDENFAQALGLNSGFSFSDGD